MPCVAKAGSLETLGQRFGTFQTVIGISCLTGPPIIGAILSQQDNRNYMGVQLFSGLFCLIGCCFLALSTRWSGIISLVLIVREISIAGSKFACIKVCTNEGQPWKASASPCIRRKPIINVPDSFRAIYGLRYVNSPGEFQDNIHLESTRGSLRARSRSRRTKRQPWNVRSLEFFFVHAFLQNAIGSEVKFAWHELNPIAGDSIWNAKAQR